MCFGLHVKRGIFIFFLFDSLIARVFLPPSIEDWLWYSMTIEYPLKFYFYNRRSNFCWDIGLTYTSFFADTALICNSFDVGKDLAVLFHGSSDFLFSDVEPLPNNVYSAPNSEYAFLPDYFFSETSCKVNLQVSRDFFWKNDIYIHSTVRCIIPFDTQAIVNIASGNMLYNTSSDAVRYKSFRENDVYKKNKERDFSSKARYFLKKNSFLEKKSVIKNNYRDIVSPYIKVKKEGENKCFAIQGLYFLQPDQELFNYVPNSINFPFVVYNKNAPSIAVLDTNNNNLSIDKLSHSYGLTANSNVSNTYYKQLVSSNGQLVFDDVGQSYAIQNTPYQSGLNANSCLVSLYTYGNGMNDANNQFFVKDDYGISYSISTIPQYIYDVPAGDIVATAPILVGNGLTGEIFTTLISQNNLLRLVATADYGKNSSLDPMWSQSYVNMGTPPVVVQQATGEFPSTFGKTINAQNLRHDYDQSAQNGIQFDYFGDYLKNNINNINPRVTLLNEDGSFYDSSADCALLWYQNNYTNLFGSQSSVLENIYITTAIDSEVDQPSEVSKIISNKIGGDDEACCDKVVTWVENCIYKPIVENMNYNFIDLQEQIWSLTSIQNVVIGNDSPITEVEQTEIAQPCNYPYEENSMENITCDSSKSNKILESSSLLERSLVDSFVSFENGSFSSMNYNGFHRTGLGDILLEFICGRYFFSDTCLLDFYAAIECPTAEGINQSTSYLAVGLGNNGHFVGRIGLQGALDIEYLYRLRITSRLYFEHGFRALEKIVPQLDGYPIFNFIPVKMDTLIDWNGGLVYVDGSLYTNDYSGLTISYQYWKKGQDAMMMTCPKLLTIQDTGDDDDSDIQIMPVFDSIQKYSKKQSHTFGVSFFSRITNETFLNAGFSRIFLGNNVPQSSDFFCSIGISY